MSAEARKPHPQRELRVALVLNGGVSLAVWMGGVTTEIDNVRRCRAAAEDPVRAAWKAIVDRSCFGNVVVDLIAGTSAGGLNGLFLGTAIARRQGFPSSLRDLWLSKADIRLGALLPDGPSASLLDGQFFQETVESALGQLTLGTEPEQDVSVLVTATSFSPFAVERSTDLGPINAADGRRVFRFDHAACVAPIADNDRTYPCTQQPQRSDLGLAASATLALAGRGSAGYPGAFDPVPLSEALAQREVEKRCTPSEYLVDGGVLDNAPFEPILEALRNRPADVPFRRALVYVKPTAPHERMKASGDAPTTLLKVLGAVLTAMREPDQRLDFEALDDAFERMQFSTDDPHRLLAFVLATPAQGDSLEAAARQLLPFYRAGRVQAAAVPDPAQWIPGTRPNFADPDNAAGAPVPRSLQVAEDGSNWQWGTGTADRVLRWFTRALNDLEPTLESADAMRQVAQATRQVTAVRANSAGGGPLSPTERAALSLVMTSAAAVTAGAIGVEPDRLMLMSLSVEVVATVLGWASGDGIDVPQFRYREVTPAARSLIPLDELAGALPPDVSRTAFAANWPSKKLYGERWEHFGAFASTDGRRHDWLWGRLDAASALADLLLEVSQDDPGHAQAIPGEDPNRLKSQLLDAILESEMSASGQPIDRQSVIHGAAKAYTYTAAELRADWQRSLRPRDRQVIADLIMALLSSNLGQFATGWALVEDLVGVATGSEQPGWRHPIRAARRRWLGPKLRSWLRGWIISKLTS